VASPAGRCRAGTSPGLPFPSAHQGLEIHSPRVLPARWGPSAGFDYPLDGLRPRVPRRFYFAPAALLGFALRSFLLWQGTAGVSAGVNPRAVSPAVFPTAGGGGPARQAAASGLSPLPKSLAATVRLARQPLAAPLGFGPHRTVWPEPGPAEAGPSAALREPPFGRSRRRADERLVPARGRPANRAATDRSCQDLRAGTTPHIRTCLRPAYAFSSRRAVHYCRPAGDL
jgi:hypothetical protein